MWPMPPSHSACVCPAKPRGLSMRDSARDPPRMSELEGLLGLSHPASSSHNTRGSEVTQLVHQPAPDPQPPRDPPSPLSLPQWLSPAGVTNPGSICPHIASQMLRRWGLQQRKGLFARQPSNETGEQVANPPPRRQGTGVFIGLNL